MKLSHEMREMLALAERMGGYGDRLRNVPKGYPLDDALQCGWLRRMFDGFGGYMITPAGLAVLNGQ